MNTQNQKEEFASNPDKKRGIDADLMPDPDTLMALASRLYPKRKNTRHEFVYDVTKQVKDSAKQKRAMRAKSVMNFHSQTKKVERNVKAGKLGKYEAKKKIVQLAKNAYFLPRKKTLKLLASRLYSKNKADQKKFVDDVTKQVKDYLDDEQ